MIADVSLALFSRNQPTTLGVPADAHLDRGGTWETLDAFVPMPSLTPQRWVELRRLASRITLARENWRQVDCTVDRGAKARRVHLERLPGQQVGVHCSGCASGARCLHVPAVFLAAIYALPALRPRLSQPPWQHFLSPLLGVGEAAVRGSGVLAPPPEKARPGWLRAVLHSTPSDARDALFDGRMTVWVMHRSKNGKKVLKPRRLPKQLDEIDQRVSGLRPGERALLARIDDLRALDDAQPPYRGWRDPEPSVERAIERCMIDILAGLSGVGEVYLDDDPIAVDDRPWAPRIVVADAVQGGLSVEWAFEPQLVFRVGAGFAVIDGVLRPIDPSVSPAVLDQIWSEPPDIPPADVPSFIDALLAAPADERAPIELRTAALPVEEHPPAPRLLLTADGDTLLVGLRFGYGSTECGFDDPEVIADPFSEPPRLIQRDRGAEAEWWGRLAEVVDALPDRPASLAFEDEAAFDFLDGLDALADFEVVTDAQLDLRRWRPRGAVSAQAGLSAGLDWFDLEVDFACGDEAIPAAAVLESWRAGRRYVRLRDGGVAHLPTAWLARHEATLAELDDLRGRRRRRVGVFAAPVVADLLDALPFADPAAEAHAARLSALARRIADFEGVPDRPPPAGLAATLRGYQHRGFRWICALADLGLAGVLADDMGLGKTVQTLAALLDAHQGPGRDVGDAGDEGPRPSLVVAPTSVIHNWLIEANRFAPSLRVALHHGPSRGAPPTDVDVVITSYPLLRVDAEALAAVQWRYVVLDEAQHIKNPASQTARAARALSAQHRLALSGTPLENHLIELWSLFEFAMPGFFGSREAFRRRYVEPTQQTEDDDRRDTALAQLRRRIRPFVLRRLKREVAAELPPRQEQVLWCDLSPPERRLYEAVKQTYRSSVMQRVDDLGVARSTIQILEALTRLRQAACDPALLPFPEARAVQHSAKRARLLETLEALAEEGHRALVFSQWPSLLKRVRADLDRAGVAYQYLDGSTRERADLQRQWNAPDGPPVFLISLKAGGTGLNLVGADVVVHLDPWWNPQTEQQATDRAHRIGQTRPVMVYKLVARGTVEEKVLELQARKRALFEAAVDGERATVDALTRADLEAVFEAEGAPEGEPRRGSPPRRGARSAS